MQLPLNLLPLRLQVTAYLNISTLSPTMSLAISQGPVVQSPIIANPGLTLNKTYGVNPGLALIGLWTTGPRSMVVTSD